MHRPVWMVCFAMGMAVTFCGAASADKIKLKSDELLSGTVIKDGLDEVAIDTDGDGKADRTVNPDEVVEITFVGAPLSYNEGAAAFRLGRYFEARRQFEEALGEAGEPSVWQQHALYMLGESTLRLAQAQSELLPQAREAFQKVIDGTPDSRLVPASLRGFGQTCLAEGDTATARSAFEKLVAEAPYGPEWALRGKLLLALVLSSEGKHDEAMKLAQTVQQTLQADDAGALAQLLPAAQSTEAELLLAAKKYVDGYEVYMQLARDADPRDVQTKAKAYNGIGDALLAAGRVEEALLAYLRVRVLYFQAQDELPHALYGAAVCFTNLKKPNEAAELIEILKKNHSRSVWTAKTLKELAD